MSTININKREVSKTNRNGRIDNNNNNTLSSGSESASNYTFENGIMSKGSLVSLSGIYEGITELDANLYNKNANGEYILDENENKILTPDLVALLVKGNTTIEGALIDFDTELDDYKPNTTALTVKGNLHVDGNITASKEITAYFANSVSDTVLALLSVSQPLIKTGSNISLGYNTNQFEILAGNLSIKPSAILSSVTWTDILNKPSFSTVAYSGNYNDLINKPNISDLPFTVTGSAGSGLVSFDRNVHIEGNLTASKEVCAYLAGALSTDIFTNLSVSQPLLKTGSNISLNYDSYYFSNTGGILGIKEGVLATKAHTHQVSDITGIHTHGNKEVIDGIESTDIDNWNTAHTKTQPISISGDTLTINKNLHIDGDITASGEIVAYLAGTLGEGVLDALSVSQPLLKTGTNIELKYNPQQFEVNTGVLGIKPSVLTPAEHNHIIDNITGLQQALDSKLATTTQTVYLWDLANGFNDAKNQNIEYGGFGNFVIPNEPFSNFNGTGQYFGNDVRGIQLASRFDGETYLRTNWWGWQGWKKVWTSGNFDPASLGTNYIQNQNSSPQAANMWISGANKSGYFIASDASDVPASFGKHTVRGTQIVASTGSVYDYSLLNPLANGYLMGFYTGTQNAKFFGSAEFASTIQATTGKFTNLTDGYIPYHISDASGLGNSLASVDEYNMFISPPAGLSQIRIGEINGLSGIYIPDYFAINAVNGLKISTGGRNANTNPDLFVNSTGNVSIGTTNGDGRLHIVYAPDINNENKAAVNIQNGDAKLLFGTIAGSYSYIQSMQSGVSWATRPISLQPMGGNVGIGYHTGTEIDNNKLAVNGRLFSRDFEVGDEFSHGRLIGSGGVTYLQSFHPQTFEARSIYVSGFSGENIGALNVHSNISTFYGNIQTIGGFANVVGVNSGLLDGEPSIRIYRPSGGSPNTMIWQQSMNWDTLAFSFVAKDRGSEVRTDFVDKFRLTPAGNGIFSGSVNATAYLLNDVNLFSSITGQSGDGYLPRWDGSKLTNSYLHVDTYQPKVKVENAMMWFTGLDANNSNVDGVGIWGGNNGGGIYARGTDGAKSLEISNTQGYIKLENTGNISVSKLAGSDTRVVTADVNGQLSTKANGVGFLFNNGSVLSYTYQSIASTSDYSTYFNANNYCKLATYAESANSSNWATNAGYATNASYVDWTGINGLPNFSNVAYSGNYNDLANKPTIINTIAQSTDYSTYFNAGNYCKLATQADNATNLAGVAGTNFYHSGNFNKTTVPITASTVNATTIVVNGWTINISSGSLIFNNGANRCKVDANGNLTASGEVTAYGTI